MREIFTYGSVGGAPGNRCFYPELGLGCDLQYRYFLKDEFIAETICILQHFHKKSCTK